MTPEQLLKLGTTIVTVTVGSRLFGTARPESDYDFIHIYKPHLNRLILGANDQPAQEKVEHDNGARHEHTYWSIQHFFKLLAQGQTQALEIAFAPANCWHAGNPKATPMYKYWDGFLKHFHKNREQWISKNTAAFVGYCKSQANKYSVKGERLEAVNTIIEWLDSLPETYNCLSTDRFCDLSPSLTGELLAYHQSNPYIDVVNIPSGHGNMMQHISVCNVKVPWHQTIREAKYVYIRLRAQYGERSKAAAGEGNIDWKALSHAARVTIEAKELLTTSNITLPLKEHDREYVRNIKAGLVSHSEVIEFLDTGLSEIEELRVSSTLNESGDRQLYDGWTLQAYAGEKVA